MRAPLPVAPVCGTPRRPLGALAPDRSGSAERLSVFSVTAIRPMLCAQRVIRSGSHHTFITSA